MLMKATHIDLPEGRSGDSRFLAEDLRPAPEICRLCTAMLLCLVLASVVTAFHGLVVLTDALRLEKPEIVFASTWGLFVLLTIAGSIMVAACIYRFQEALVEEKKTRIRSMVSGLSRLDKQGDIAGPDQWLKILEFADRIRTVPLGPAGVTSVAVTALSQAVNLGVAAVALFGSLKDGGA